MASVTAALSLAQPAEAVRPLVATPRYVLGSLGFAVATGLVVRPVAGRGRS